MTELYACSQCENLRCYSGKNCTSGGSAKMQGATHCISRMKQRYCKKCNVQGNQEELRHEKISHRVIMKMLLMGSKHRLKEAISFKRTSSATEELQQSELLLQSCLSHPCTHRQKPKHPDLWPCVGHRTYHTP